MTKTPHGAPDWSKYRPTSVTFPVLDLAELAARLYSPNVFDRRGDVVFMDDFEQGLNKWWPITVGAGTVIELAHTPTKLGGYSVRLHPAAVGGAEAAIRLRHAYPASDRLSLECAFTVHPFMGAIQFSIRIYTQTRVVRGEILYNHAATTLSYFDAAGNWTVLNDDIELIVTTHMFHVIKIAIDKGTEHYIRCILDDTEYDLSAIAAYAADNVTNSYQWNEIRVIGTGDDETYSYIDCVITTQDEP